MHKCDDQENNMSQIMKMFLSNTYYVLTKNNPVHNALTLNKWVHVIFVNYYIVNNRK